jgi:uncharacterized protein (TIGR03086 family)
MAQPLPELHERALDVTRTYIAGIRSDQWSDSTPDPEWDVRTLVNHIVSGNCWVTPLMSGQTIDQVGDALDGDVLGDDPLAAYDRSAKEAAATFSAPGAMESPANVSYGPVPGEIYAGHRFLDVLIHGWDVAKATGQDPTLDPELVAELRAVVDPQLDLLQASGAFGSVEVPAGADPQTELLALLGRRA